MGTKHSVRHYHGFWACGIYCNKDLKKDEDGTTFELKSANQRWCRCPVCSRVREKHERGLKKLSAKTRIRLSRADRQAAYLGHQPPSKIDRDKDLLGGRRLKDGWKPCQKCGTLTPNRFGLCRSCNERLGDLVDIDAIVTWHSGPAIHRRGMGTVCRVGGSVI